jgi:hypothetical protein
MPIRMTNRLFGSHPLVVHCPGALPEDWTHLCDEVFAAPPRRCSVEDLTIVTWNVGTGGGKPVGTLERSLRRLDVDPVVLGAGTTSWRNILKLRLTAEALARVTTPFVAGFDSSDVLVLDDPALLVERFRAHFTCDLLFNATGPPCWPVLPEFIHFESTRPAAALARGRHWLNAGTWIGRTDFCRRFFSALAEAPPVRGFEASEQAVVKQAWPRWYPRVQLDYGCSLLQWFKEDPAVLVFERPAQARQNALLEIVRTLGRPIRGAEVGVYEGSTADVLLREIEDLTLWLVDPWVPYQGRDSMESWSLDQFARARARARFRTRHAEGRRFLLEEPSPQAARRFADASLDFVFIDACHLYESVRADLTAWWPKIRPDGLLSGHDYRRYGDLDRRWGVSRAVDEFAAPIGRAVGLGADGVWWIRR